MKNQRNPSQVTTQPIRHPASATDIPSVTFNPRSAASAVFESRSRSCFVTAPVTVGR
jgi:hypothetical protein